VAVVASVVEIGAVWEWSSPLTLCLFAGGGGASEDEGLLGRLLPASVVVVDGDWEWARSWSLSLVVAAVGKTSWAGSVISMEICNISL